MTDTQHSHPKHPSQPSPHGVTGSGQYSCPACEKRFDTPGLYSTSKGRLVPWYRSSPTFSACVHCHAVARWQPVTSVTVWHEYTMYIAVFLLAWVLHHRPSSLRIGFRGDWVELMLPAALLFWMAIVIKAFMVRLHWRPQAAGSWLLVPATKNKAQWIREILAPVCLITLSIGASIQWKWLPPPQQDAAWWGMLILAIIVSMGSMVWSLMPAKVQQQ